MKTKFVSKLKYEDIFNDSDTVEKLAIKVSKDEALVLLSLINAKISSIHTKPGLEKHFILNEWLKFSDEGVKYRIKHAYGKYYKHKSDGSIDLSSVVILNKITTLRLIEIILTNPQFINKKIDAKTASESLFRLYLLIGSEITERQDKAFKAFLPSNGEKGKIIRLHLFMGLTYVEPSNYITRSQVFISQFLKFIQFEKWLRSKKEFENLERDYLNEIGVKKWSEYINDVFQINSLSFQHIIIYSDSNPVLKNTLDYLSSEVCNKTAWNELLAVKKNPLYKINDSKYLVLDLDFLIEKFFTNVYHDLVHLSKKQNLLAFHSDYNKEFMEEYLLNKSIENIFGKSFVKFTQTKMNTLKPQKSNIGLPDYYIRNGNKVLIFECKNSYISHELINKLDLKLLEDDIKNKFYVNTKKRKKAIKQLMDFIVNSTNGNYSFFDSSAKPNKLIYYPILIITDPLLRSMGFNKLMNEYLDLEKEMIDNDLRKRILSVTVIHIDDLLFYDKDLKQLGVLIKDYHKYLSNKEYIEEMISFSVYLSTIKFPNYKRLNEKLIKEFVKDSFISE